MTEPNTAERNATNDSKRVPTVAGPATGRVGRRYGLCTITAYASLEFEEPEIEVDFDDDPDPEDDDDPDLEELAIDRSRPAVVRRRKGLRRVTAPT